MKLFRLLLPVLITVLSGIRTLAAYPAYDSLFTGDRLRIDLVLAGNAASQSAYLSALHREPQWAGSRTALTDPYGYGDYRYELRQNGRTVFSRGFNTLFREWRSTPEAERISRAMNVSVWTPFPKTPLELVVSARNPRNGSQETLLRMQIDPASATIRQGLQHNWPATCIQRSGDPSEKVDLVFIAEGYTADEMELFRADCRRFAESLFAMPPYDRHRDDFNIWAVECASPESGTDFPHRNEWKQTVAHSHFYTFETDRYLTAPDQTLLASLASGVPCDALYVIVNTDEYGGGGIYNYYGLSMARGPYASEVFVHEFGHSFANLGDEYYDNSVAYEGYLDTAAEPHEPNLTTLRDFSRKWQDMLPEGIPVPTPPDGPYRDSLGVFEGGGYTARGVYRPAVDCRMKTNGAPGFCPVCRRAIERMIECYTR